MTDNKPYMRHLFIFRRFFVVACIISIAWFCIITNCSYENQPTAWNSSQETDKLLTLSR